MSSSLSMTMRGQAGGLLATIRKTPLLSAEEEVALFQRWQNDGDERARQAIIMSHLKLVVSISKRYTSYGIPLAELVHEGCLGIIHAISKFDPSRGVRFSTYASWWARTAIRDYVSRTKSLVVLPSSRRRDKRGNNAAVSPEADLSADSASAPTPYGLHNAASDSSTDSRRGPTLIFYSLNSKVDADSTMEWQDLLVDDSQSYEDSYSANEEFTQRKATLRSTLATLGRRERVILGARHLLEKPCTLDRLSRMFGVSQERIRQIELRALQKLKEQSGRQMARSPD